jgi:Flp pilus assembly protein TadG
MTGTRPPRRRPRSRPGADDGFITVELILWAAPLALLVMIIVAGARITHARALATGAADDAARAASLYRGSGSPDQVAIAAADTALANAGISCRSVNVTVTGGTQPGQIITVDVYCTAVLSDLAVPGLPGSLTMHSSASVPIEKTRTVPLGLSAAPATAAAHDQI